MGCGSASLVKGDEPSLELDPVRKVIGVAAENLGLSASLICESNAYPMDDPLLAEKVRESTRRLDQVVETELVSEVSALLDSASQGPVSQGPVSQGPGSDGLTSEVRASDGPIEATPPPQSDGELPSDGGGIASLLDPSFHPRALAIATGMVADAALESSGARPMTDRSLSMPGETALQQTRRRLVSHLSFRSVWFRNAVRGAAGMALAVLVVEITNVEHGFWVVLGTLSVLRSNALGTGFTALRAVGGTTVGFIVGSAIMIGIGAHPVLLWVLLPIAVMVSGVAPSMISFAAGQAAFTLVVIILFNIIAPVGWKVGLTRIEDVAMRMWSECRRGTSLWPRGTTGSWSCAVGSIRRQLGLSGRLRRAPDHHRAPGRHRTGPTGIATRLPTARRCIPSVLGRTGGEGRPRRDGREPVHRCEPHPASREHVGDSA